MKLKVVILGDVIDSFTDKAGKPMQFRQLNCFDSCDDPRHAMKNTFDFSIPRDQWKALPVGRFNGQTVEIAVKEVKVGQGGRMSCRGEFLGEMGRKKDYFLADPEPMDPKAGK